MHFRLQPNLKVKCIVFWLKQMIRRKNNKKTGMVGLLVGATQFLWRHRDNECW